MKELIYFDHAASTPMDKLVLKKMISFLKQKNNFGNASSQHCFGFNLKLYILDAKNKISKIINSKYDEIIFTSSSTESNNMVLKGLLQKNLAILTNKLEHKSITIICESLKTKNKAIFVKHKKNGFIKSIDILFKLKKHIILVSISHVNNEIGVTQNIRSIGNICKIFNKIFHTDATQSIGKRYINVNLYNIDLLSLSSHKIYGPPGIAALYISKKIQKIFKPLIEGGRQEYGLRAGSLPTHQIIGFGEACKILKQEILINRIHINKLNKYFIKKLKKIKNIKILFFKNQIPDIINIYIKKINFSSLINSFKNIAISIGSACNLNNNIVINTLNIKRKFIENSIRISLGKDNTFNEIDIFCIKIKKLINFFIKIN